MMGNTLGVVIMTFTFDIQRLDVYDTDISTLVGIDHAE